jgi:hypothetical protein
MPKRHRSAALLLVLSAMAAAAPASAGTLWTSGGPPPDPGERCRAAIRLAERAAGIPLQLMAAIGRVESGRPGPDGRINPWPWSINVEGVGHVFETKPQAIAAVRALQARGIRSIDVGCMQVNLQQHPDAFASLEAAFDPAINAAYAARFLTELRAQSGSWEEAAGLYHSATPALKAGYRHKVMAAWPVELRTRGDESRLALENAWAATLPQAGPSGIGYGVGPGGSAPAYAHMLPRNPVGARVLPLAAAPAGMATGRALTAYRAVPIPLAGRATFLPRRTGIGGNG